jgi:sodium-dependent dicarboxylate transporter 2/3/5
MTLLDKPRVEIVLYNRVLHCVFYLVTKPPPTILTWKVVAHKLPWNVVFLLGGGFALAEAAQVQTN